MRSRIRPRYRVGLAALFVVAAAMVVGGSSAFAAGNAGYTTFDATLGGCVHGSPNGINCNTYAAKEDVYMNGGPNGGNGLANGDYYFAVLTPGSQNGGFIDGVDGNLSDITQGSTVGDNGSGDDVSNRTFTVTNGLISFYGGTHATGLDPQGQFIIGLAPFDDTDNPGGVYILAICEVGATSPSQCKYDMFKVGAGETQTAQDLSILKNAAGGFTRTFGWDAAKTVDRTRVEQVGGTATFNYVVSVTRDSGSDSGFQVVGDITVFNPNTNLTITGVSLTDSTNVGGTCLIDGQLVPGSYSVGSVGPQDSVTVNYVCSFGSTSPGDGTNTATATWDAANGTPDTSASWPADFTFGDPTTIADDCATFTDTFGLHGTTGTLSTLGTVCTDGTTDTASNLGTGVTWDATTSSFKYARVITIPTSGCLTYDNTADFTTNTNGSTDSTPLDNSQSVTVCGPAHTGALTMGFWKNSNGQTLIKYYCNLHSPSLATYLSTLGGNFTGPFAGAAGQTCAGLMTYTSAIFKAASATNMNYMLRAQMLATALDVYFSSTGYQTTSVSKSKPPSAFLPNGGIGSFNMDMTAICPMVDNTTAGTATCKLGLPSTDAYASGAVPAAAMTVDAILAFAASNPPYTTSGNPGIWYAGNRTKQEILKNIFDQINNQDAFGA
jgi:hypothetical protein